MDIQVQCFFCVVACCIPIIQVSLCWASVGGSVEGLCLCACYNNAVHVVH